MAVAVSSFGGGASEEGFRAGLRRACRLWRFCRSGTLFLTLAPVYALLSAGDMMSQGSTYSISALSRKTGLSIHTLRFYEKEGILRYVERTPSGRRVYSDDSLACLLGVLCLKEAGFSLPEIKAFFDSTREGADSLPERLEMLRRARAHLEAQRDHLERSLRLINYFLEGGEAALSARERGEDPDAVFPFFTKQGIVHFPYVAQVGDRLEVFAPGSEPRADGEGGENASCRDESGGEAAGDEAAGDADSSDGEEG